ncbi:MAG: hypothetical protein ABSF61_00165 [Anaerolineales bacterium]|jgi:threonine/homoserine/homoserine lactone efflux protein
MNVKERLGCFLSLIGVAALVLFGLPIWEALQGRPRSIDQTWILGALSAIVLVWIGIRLAWAGRREAGSSKPPSLARSVRERFRRRKDDTQQKG